MLDETQSLNLRNMVLKKDDGYLVPITADKDVAPANILKVIKFKCKSTSKNQCWTNLCSRKKNGLKCMSAYGGCHGEDWNNKKVKNYQFYLGIACTMLYNFFETGRMPTLSVIF